MNAGPLTEMMTGPLSGLVKHGIEHADKTGPLTDVALHYLTDTVLVNLITAAPIIAVVALSAYALGSMIHKSIGKLGAIGVVIYGILIVL